MEVHSVRTALRRDSRGQTMTDIVVEVTQRRRGYFTKEAQQAADAKTGPANGDIGDFKFRSGCTIIIDSTTKTFRHIIRTPGTIVDEDELALVRNFLTGETDGGVDSFDGRRQPSLTEPRVQGFDEPFALLHRHSED